MVSMTHTYPILSCWTKLTARDTAVERRSPWEVMMFHTSNLHSFFQIQVDWNIYHGISWYFIPKKSTNRPSSCKLIDISLTISMSLSGSQQLDGWFRTNQVPEEQAAWRQIFGHKQTVELSDLWVLYLWKSWLPSTGTAPLPVPSGRWSQRNPCPLGITERLRP